MKHLASRDLRAYWDRLRGDASMPDRRDFDPLAVRQWLDWVAMVDTDLDAGVPVRVAGAGLSSLFCRQLRGQSFLSLWRRGERADAAELVEAASIGAEPVCVPLRATPFERAPVELELLVLPFSHDGRPGSRALCALSLAELPRWIGLLPAGPLTSDRTAHRLGGPGGPRVFPTRFGIERDEPGTKVRF